jgi:8-oxo-dGTP diphosphatase
MASGPALTIAVAVVVHDGRVLVGKRSATAAQAAGMDEFPGGKLEPGETPADAAARECLEETGIAARIGERLDAVETTAGDRAITVIFLAGAPLDPAAVPTPPFEWIGIADLRTRMFPAANAGVIAMLERDHGGS